jgi:predicted DNA-binding protein YlxM (UPF0122 family)
LTRVKRSEIDKLFNKPPTLEADTSLYNIEDCYKLSEVQSKYNISEKGLYDLIKRNKIPKIKKGWFVYVPKSEIHKHLGED